MLIKKDNKVVGYRQDSELRESQAQLHRKAREDRLYRLKEAEKLLDSWAYWMTHHGLRKSNLCDIGMMKDFSMPMTSSIPPGVEMTRNVATALQIFEEMKANKRGQYIHILQIVHLKRAGERSIDRVIDNIRDEGILGISLRNYRRAKENFAFMIKSG